MRLRLWPCLLAAAGFFLGTFFGATPGRGQRALAVDPSDPVYEDLDHFRALGLWRGSLETRPVAAEELRRAYAQIRANLAGHALGAGDRLRLDRLGQRLDPPRDAAEPDGSALARQPDGNTPARQAGETTPAQPAEGALVPPVVWKFGFALRGVGASTGLDSLPDLQRRPRRDWSFAFRQDVQIGRRFTIQSRFYEDYSRLTPNPRRGWADQFPISGGGVLQDPSARNDRAVAGLHGPWYDLRFGREDRKMGVGRHGTLFFSENAFPLDGLSAQLRTRYLSLSSLVGQSSRKPTGALPESLAAGDAYVACHRFELHPTWPRSTPIRIGFFEAAAYGGRSFDLGYANPFALLTALTQDVFDRYHADDKKVVGGDLQVDLHPVSLYGEFLLNRLMSMRQAAGGGKAEISSTAQLAGLRWADPFAFSGGDLSLEYAHLDPEVYFHKDRDPNRALLSAGEPLGYWLGPNGDDLFCELALPPLDRWGRVRCSFEQTRWGLLPAQPGSDVLLRGIDLGFIGLEKKDKRWITGEVQRERILAVEWTRQGWKTPLPGLFDSGLTLASVDRTGPGRAGTGRWRGSGLLLEMRLTWRLEFLWRQASLEG